MKKIIIGAGTAFVLFFAGNVSAGSYQFNSNLEVGSSGQGVAALQSWLIQNGYNIPSVESGLASKGTFGSQTKAAVMAYQKSAGLPSTGFVGPLTRASLNGNSVSVSPASSVSLPVSSVSAATSTPASPFPPGFTTPGIEGMMAVTQGPLSNTTLYAGETQAPIMDVRIQAQYSDIDVAGLLLDLGTDNTLSDFVFSKIYVTDGTNILASTTLNSTTVVDDYGRRVLGIDGFNYIVPKGTYKDLVIKADLYPSINTTYTSQSPWYISLDPNALGGVDGIGQDLYGPPVDPIVEALNINQSLITSATANISLDGSSPLTGSVGVTNATQGQYLGLPVMVFDVNAQGDTLHLHSVAVGVANTGGGTVNAAYLYQGSTPISSASIVNGVATFSNISDGQTGASIPVNTTVPFTVKVDVSGLTSGVNPAMISASTSALTIYSSIDSNVGISGTAISNVQTVFGQGPVISLSSINFSAPSVLNTTTGGTSTLKYTATFNLNLQAIGENVNFGLPSTTTAAFGTSSTATNFAQLYVNSAPAVNDNGIQVIAGYNQPTNTTLSPDGTYFTLAQNQSVSIPVTYSWSVVTGPSTPANTYGIQFQGFQWFTSSNGSGATTTNFMKNQTAWRTNSY